MASSSPFTVIIPVYKGEAYLAETLSSVLAQTLPPAEILVLDDGSPDNSAAIAASFGERIRIIRKPNSGVADTRNQGAALASTDFLCFLDQDDIWTPDHLQRHAALLAQHPEADVIYSGRRLLNQDLATGSFHLTAPAFVPSPQQLASSLRERCPFTPSAVTLRRSVFQEIGGFRSKHNSVEDWDLWLRLQRHGATFIQDPDPTLHYRVHAAANTNNPLPVLGHTLGVVHENVTPYLSPWQRLTLGNRIVSRLEGEAAILLRQNKLPGARALMSRSILRHPFHEPRRYKILAHMLLHGTR